MNITMAGIDHSIAKLSVRELFSFTKLALENIYSSILEYDYIKGVVIISTCNRTEIYVSLADDISYDPFSILSQSANIDIDVPHTVRNGDDVVRHLCELSCGMKSQIWGEDQIIAQVKNAIVFARENKAADSVMEVLFRTAITAAKKIKTEIRLTDRESSVVVKAMEVLKKFEQVKNVLVIGNGEIGRLMANTLVKSGYSATITLRQYKYSMNIVPTGVRVVEYNERYNQMMSCDAVISATLSPHHTIEAEQIQMIEQYPKVFIDLAVPRDIDPKVNELCGVSLYDIDSMCAKDIEKNHSEQIKQAEKIMQKYIGDFYSWCKYKAELVSQTCNASN